MKIESNRQQYSWSFPFTRPQVSAAVSFSFESINMFFNQKLLVTRKVRLPVLSSEFPIIIIKKESTYYQGFEILHKTNRIAKMTNLFLTFWAKSKVKRIVEYNNFFS